MGDIAHTIYRAYEKSRDNENEILNFDDIIWDRDVEALTACMKENGIKAFTYSCRATDAVETLMAFQRGRLHDRRDGRGQPQEGLLRKGLRKGPRLQDDPELKRPGREPHRGLFLVEIHNGCPADLCDIYSTVLLAIFRRQSDICTCQRKRHTKKTEEKDHVEQRKH
jgi:hypothetical protein